MNKLILALLLFLLLPLCSLAQGRLGDKLNIIPAEAPKIEEKAKEIPKKEIQTFVPSITDGSIVQFGQRGPQRVLFKAYGDSYMKDGNEVVDFIAIKVGDYPWTVWKTPVLVNLVSNYIKATDQMREGDVRPPIISGETSKNPSTPPPMAKNGYNPTHNYIWREQIPNDSQEWSFDPARGIFWRYLRQGEDPNSVTWTPQPVNITRIIQQPQYQVQTQPQVQYQQPQVQYRPQYYPQQQTYQRPTYSQPNFGSFGGFGGGGGCSGSS